MGLPALIFVVADNQELLAETLDRAGIVQKTNEQDLLSDLITLMHDRKLWRLMVTRGRRLVDGLGTGRMVSTMLSEMRGESRS